MTGVTGLRERLPLRPGTLRRVLAGVLLLSCAEFVRSGLYAGYLPQVVSDLLGLPKADAVVFSGSAFTAHFIADTAMPIENQAMAPIMTLRRPIRSPRVPATRAPSIMPIIAYEPSMPASFGVSAWSPIHLAESGPMKPGRTAP